MKQFILVSYDISDDKRRTKVMKALEDFGKRVQYSVFECRLTPAQIEKLKRRVQPFVRDEDDSVRFYPISADDVGRIQVLGSGAVTPERQYYLQ
jgi:CRISPR-associated protein Cas2